MNINQLKISTKLGLAFGFMVLMLAALGGMIGVMSSSVEQSISDITERQTPIIRNLGRLRDEINLQARLSRNMVIFTDAAEIEGERQRILKSLQVVTDTLARLDQRIHSTEGKRLEGVVKELREKFKVATDKFLATAQQGTREEAINVLMKELRPSQLPYFEAIERNVSMTLLQGLS